MSEITITTYDGETVDSAQVVASVTVYDGGTLGGGGGGSDVTLDADGTLVVDGLTVELATDAQLADEAALARNADNLTSGTVADARIASTIARDSEVTAAVAAEAALARNADNLTSGTVADARIASTIARDSEVTAAANAAQAAAEATADAALDAHVAAGDPHPQYLTATEGDAAYDALGDAASAVATHSADTTGVHGIADTADLVLDDDARLTNSRTPTGAAGGVLGGTYPNPSFAADMATQAELDAHASDTTAVHGIADTSALIVEGDSRLTNSRTPSGAAGGVLSGTYPNPGFASDMATQAELDAHVNDTSAAHAASAISYAGSTNLSATDVEAALDELDSEKASTGHTHSSDSTKIDKSTLDANTILYAVTDDTPAALSVAASRIVGRKATGDIDDMTTAEVAALFGTPDGTKFLADDGTLKTPSGGGSTISPLLLMGA